MNPAFIIAFAAAALAGLLALVVVCEEQPSLTRWCFAAGLALLAAESLFAGLTLLSTLAKDLAYWQSWRLGVLSLAPGPWLLFSVSYGRQDYRAALARWWLALAAAFALPLGLLGLFHRFLLLPAYRASSEGPCVLGLDGAGMGIYLTFLLAAVLVLVNLERTFRAAGGVLRWRIKFLVLGLGVLFALRAYTCGNALLFGTLDLPFQVVNSGTLVLAVLLVGGSLWRGKPLEVVVYPAPAPLLQSLTLIPCGVFLLMVGVLGKVLGHFRGHNTFVLEAMLGVAGLVLLTMALFSERMRAETRRLVCRYLQRPQYDYLAVWRAFTEGTARHLEPPQLCRAIAHSVSDLFQSLSVTVWLVDERLEKLTCAASTTFSRPDESGLALETGVMAQVLAGLRDLAEPTDLEVTDEAWAALLRRLHPAVLDQGGHRVCVPLRVRGELLGVMVLGDRVGGETFSLQELELVKSLSGQAAAGLLNLQLAQKLSQAQKIEAFQAMSTFFIHDLKNTASTLSLMLQNVPAHFSNPEFQQDTLRGIAKAADHLNAVVARLHLLRQDLAAPATVVDLNGLVAETLRGLEALGPHRVLQEFRPVRPVRAHPEQLRTVVVNLVLNAREAAPKGGEIRVQTGLQQGRAFLAVSDDGCGMSAEFIRSSLFRPFHTTKKNGLGIGLFQCKQIIEAHQGRMEVQSQPGRGTTFRVWLPLAGLVGANS